MRLESMSDFLNESGIDSFFPINFPSESEICSVANITGGTVARGEVYQVHLRILTRESHPSKSINKAHEIKKYLYKNLKGAFFNGKKILKVETDTPEPLPVGEENGLHTVSWNYTILEG